MDFKHIVDEQLVTAGCWRLLEKVYENWSEAFAERHELLEFNGNWNLDSYSKPSAPFMVLQEFGGEMYFSQWFTEEERLKESFLWSRCEPGNLDDILKCKALVKAGLKKWQNSVIH